jgi:Flp pilus assembly protein TadG
MISQLKNRFWKCSAGAVAVMTALVIPVLLGFTSLGIEVGHWYLGQREMQGAADAAVFSAAAEYIHQYNTGGPSNSYQTVGVNYALTNGFTIPTQNVCLWTSSGTNCGSQEMPFTPICPPSTSEITYVCVAVEITQNTANWLTTKASFEPGSGGNIIQAIPTPTLLARSVVAIEITTTPGHAGNGCLLALEPSGVGINFNGGGSSGGFTGTNCTLASDSKPTSLSAPVSNNSSINAYAAILDGAPPPSGTGLSCPKNNCNFSNGVTYNTITPDPYTGRIYGTAPTAPAQQTVTLSQSGTTVTVTLPTSAPYLFKNEQVVISAKKSTQTVTIASVISPTKFTYTASSIPTGTITFDPCPSFTPGATNSGGVDSQHMQCYTGGSTSNTTSFNQYTIFNSAMSLGGATIFDGTPTAPAVYAFANGLTLGGTSTLGAGIYYVANGLTSSNGSVSCGVAADTAYSTSNTTFPPSCTLNNNAYGGITIALTSGAFQAASNSTNIMDWTALCTDSTGGVVGCDTQSNPILDAAGKAIDTSGIVLFASRSGGVTTKLSGAFQFWINGTMYFPNEVWSQSGQVTFNPTPCAAIIAQEIDMSGNANMTNGCLTGVGGSPSVSSASWPPVLSE